MKNLTNINQRYIFYLKYYGYIEIEKEENWSEDEDFFAAVKENI